MNILVLIADFYITNINNNIFSKETINENIFKYI